MEDILRVFVGQHIIGLGSPIIVHTGWGLSMHILLLIR
jgi:hypothetical protein